MDAVNYSIGSCERGVFKNLEAAEKWISDGMLPSQFKFVVEHRDSPGSFIGVIGLNPLGHLGYMLDPSAWSKGYAIEVLIAYLPALFKHMPELEKVDV